MLNEEMCADLAQQEGLEIPKRIGKNIKSIKLKHEDCEELV